MMPFDGGSPCKQAGYSVRERLDTRRPFEVYLVFKKRISLHVGPMISGQDWNHNNDPRSDLPGKRCVQFSLSPISLKEIFRNNNEDELCSGKAVVNSVDQAHSGKKLGLVNPTTYALPVECIY